MGADADRLREDISLLRVIIDAELANGADKLLLTATARVLYDRKRRLEQAEQLPPGDEPITRSTDPHG